jgi:hypothetical protein
VIAENMYAQCDEEGNQFNLMECIVDHKTDGHILYHTDIYISSTEATKKSVKQPIVGTCMKSGTVGQQVGSDL